MGLKFRIITKLRHAENLGPYEKGGLVMKARYIQFNTHRRGSMYGNIKDA
jgi:hypothetical protein